MGFKKEDRSFGAAAFFVLLLVGMVGFLTFIPVPEENDKLIVAIIGVIVGGAAPSMQTLFGKQDDENDRLKERLSKLETEYAVLEAKYDQVMEMLVKRHVVNGEGLEIPEKKS